MPEFVLPRLAPGSSAAHYAEWFAAERLREGPIKNRAPWIDALIRLVDRSFLPGSERVPGPPYCAIGVSAMFLLCGEPSIRTASSQAIRRQFAKKGLLSSNPDDLLQWEGALFGWTNADRARGHVGLVLGRLTDKGRVVGIRTMEFNTDLGGDRDGDGAYKLVRRLRPDGWLVEDAAGELRGPAKDLWFCNTSGLRGGAYWA